MKIVKVYTQTDNKKIAIAVLNTKKSVYGYTTETPSTAVEQFGKIEGEIVSYWGKLPVVLVPVEQFDAIAKTKGNEVLEYRGPADTTRIRESKPRPDAAALRLYKVFATDAAAPQVDNEGLPVKITVDGYSFYSGAGESLLKALKREYSFTKSDIAAALAMVIDTPADAEPSEQPAAVADTPAPAPEVAAVTDADIYAAAARIRANHEAMQADIEADKQRAADMFADAITAYCESIEPPAAPRWEPETIIIKPVFRDAEPTPAPIHRRRLSLPRLRPAFRRLLRVAAVVFPLLVFALLTASSQTAAAPADAAPVAVTEAAPLVADADAVADTVVYCAGELPPVEVCAPRTPAGQKCCTPSRSKNAVAVADTPAGQKTASSCTPSSQKTAPDAVTDAPQLDSQPHGLTICAGTAWKYTMMNWA